jgi:hypothetical protein
VLFALTPLAHATPADPTWIGGLYDDNDYDDVVLFVTGAVSVVQAGVVDAVGPVAVFVGRVAPGRPRTVATRPLESRSTRAPPRPLA